MDFQIHCIETEAYGAVLRAFIAQSEVLSWGKEELITELRKELRVSDIEHREILSKISLDDSIMSIREWRKGARAPHLSTMNTPASDPIVMGQVSRKRLKPAQAPLVSSPIYSSHVQRSPMHVRDGQWASNAAAFSPQMHSRQLVVPVSQIRLPQPSGKVKGMVQASKKDLVHSGFGSGNRSDIIELRATDKLINEVERICGGVNPDPSQIQKARLVLREHEKALMDAIKKVAKASDGDDSSDHRQKQHQYSNEEKNRNVQGFPSVAYNQFDSRINCVDDFSGDHVGGTGIPCIDLQDDDFGQGC